VKSGRLEEAYPIEITGMEPKDYADELVLFQNGQALPLFLIQYDPQQSIKEFDSESIREGRSFEFQKNCFFFLSHFF